MTRGPALVDVIAPNAGAAVLLLGCEKFTSLNTLKNSVRNSPLKRSVMGMNFTTLKSTLCWPGPYNRLREDVPYGGALVKSEVNAAVLKYSFSLLLVEPGSVSGSPGTMSARLKMAEGTSDTTENGKPLCSVIIVANSQLLARRPNAFDSPLYRFGRS